MALAVCGASDELQHGRMPGSCVVRFDDGQPGNAGETDNAPVHDVRGGGPNEIESDDSVEDWCGMLRAIAVIVGAEFLVGFAVWLAFQ